MCLECKEENKFQVILQLACSHSIASEEREEEVARIYHVGSQELARHQQVFSFLLSVVGCAVCGLPAASQTS